MTLLGILIPALLVALALRRWFVPLPWTVVGLALALTLGFLHGAIFTRALPVPVDEVMRSYPYRGVFGDVTSRNALTNDTVKQILPWMQVVREELLHGRLPLWNRHQFAGYPLLANGQSAPFAPLFLATLFVPLPDQLIAMAGLKLFLAIVFAWMFLRDEGVSPIAAFFASALFAFSVFQTVYLYYPLGTVSAMLPAAAFATIGCARSRDRRWFVLLAIVTATVLASGHPETAVHIGIACALLLVLEGKSPLRPLLAALAGAALAAPAWFPVLEQVLISARAAALAATPHPSLHPYVAYLFLNPDAFGNPARGTWSWISNYSVVAPTYLGLIPLALLPGARGRREITLVAMSALLFIIAMNWTPLGHALNAIPPLSLIAPDRLRVVVLFFIAIVAARVLDRTRKVEVIVAGVAILAAAIWLLHAKWNVTLDWRSTAGAIALGAFLIAYAFKRAQLVATIAIVAELFVFNAHFNALAPRAYYKPKLPILATLQQLSKGEPSRIVGHDWTFLPNAAAQYGLEDIRGTDPMALATYERFLGKLAVQDPSTDVKRIQDVEQPALERLNVRFLISDPQLTPSSNWLLRYEGPDGKLFERAHWQRRFFSSDANVGAITQLSATKLRVEIDSPRDGAVVHSSQIAAPGWRVRGATMFVEEPFIAFRAPAGRSVVTLTYAPVSFYAGCAVAMLALVALLLPDRVRVK
ncbi:MAG TPA: hypothetical protein VF787_28820 [Thermoanaerobaculia bacterium]